MKRVVLLVVVFAALLMVSGVAQTPTEAGRDWAYPLGDAGSTRFSALTQINASNVATLQQAWVFRTGAGRFAYPPMVVDSVMYFSTPGGVFAIDAVTGEQIWKFAPTVPGARTGGAGAAGGGRGVAPAPPGGRGAAPAGRGGGGGGGGARGTGVGTALFADTPARLTNPDPNIGTALRGPLYWPGANGLAPRIYSSTARGIAAIDAKTGTLVPTFADNGVLVGIRDNSPPMFFRNLLLSPGPTEPGKGDNLQAFDIATGAHVWTFYFKAQPGDPNRATWLNGSADADVSPGFWGTLSVDEARGLIFLPIERMEGNGNNDYWGGGSHGTNLYSDSLVALDGATGRMKWYQQLIHHDIWDYDVAAAPVLFEVRQNGRVIPAVAQLTKTAMMYIFNRETGEPIFGIEERPVPQTTVPGEWTAPTQPFPVKPAPLSRHTLTRAELAKVTPEHQAFCENLWDSNNLRDAVPFDPWRIGENTLVFPGAQGGSNWWGVTYNRPLGLLIGNVHDAGQWGQLELAPGAGTVPVYRKVPGPFNRFWNIEKEWSCSAPPWGELVAVDANTGDVAWRVPLGEFEELTARGVPQTGTPSSGGAITTAGNLVFISATIDSWFRAFDARNGKELWRTKLPLPSHGIPTTYMGRNGKQYVVVGANGGGFFGAPVGDEVIAFALP